MRVPQLIDSITEHVRTPTPLMEPRFRRLWLGSTLIAVSTWIERIAIGWLVLEITNSILLATLAYAVRNMPSMLLGPIGGALVDSFPRHRVIALSATVRACTNLCIGLVALGAAPATWLILLLAAIGGTTRTTEMPATYAMISDIFGMRGTPRAIGIHGFGVRAIGLAGSLGGGLTIEKSGSATAFFLGAGFLLAGAFAILTIPSTRPATRPRNHVNHIWRETLAGVQVMLSSRFVVAILLITLLTEMFAFSYNALLPAVAHQALNSGAAALGVMTFTAGIGALAGMVIMVIGGPRLTSINILIAVVACFGSLLIGLGLVTSMERALPIIAGIGVVASLFDAITLALVQQHVPHNMRGRALGGWVWAIGFGWIGAITLGLVSEFFGVATALNVGGAVVLSVALIAIVGLPKITQSKITRGK